MPCYACYCNCERKPTRKQLRERARAKAKLGSARDRQYALQAMNKQ